MIFVPARNLNYNRTPTLFTSDLEKSRVRSSQEISAICTDLYFTLYS